LLAAALLLTGCTGGGPQPTETLADGTAPATEPATSTPTTSRPAPGPTHSPTSAPGGGTRGTTGESDDSSGSGGGSGSGGTGSGSGGSPTPAVTWCTGANLSVAVAADPQRSEMGRRAFRITFTNVGRAACTMKGYPQVSATGRGSHTPIGEPAVPDERYTPRLERLAPGASRAAMLLAVNIDEHGGPYGDGDTDRCGTATGDGYLISAPADPKVFQISRSDMLACTTEVQWMRVSPVLVP
jgi:hypothetical protein